MCHIPLVTLLSRIFFYMNVATSWVCICNGGSFPSFAFILLAIELYVFLLESTFFSLFAILIGFLIYSDQCLLIGIIYTYCDY